jgi:hypothetical protein
MDLLAIFGTSTLSLVWAHMAVLASLVSGKSVQVIKGHICGIAKGIHVTSGYPTMDISLVHQTNSFGYHEHVKLTKYDLNMTCLSMHFALHAINMPLLGLEHFSQGVAPAYIYTVYCSIIY